MKNVQALDAQQVSFATLGVDRVTLGSMEVVRARPKQQYHASAKVNK